MILVKIIFNIYIVLTIYILLAISLTNLSIVDIIPAIIFIWILFSFFCLGFLLPKEKKYHLVTNSNYYNWLILRNKKTLTLIILLSFTSSLLSSNFYTGQTVLSVMENLVNNVSLYSLYQDYFLQNNLAQFSIEKIPYIFLMFVNKFLLLYSFFSFVLLKNKLSLFDKFYLFLIFTSYIFFGLSRGTSFEFFESFLLIIILFSIRLKSKKLKIKSFFVLASISALIIFIFNFGITSRGFAISKYISSEIYYEDNFFFSNFIGNLIILFFGYFGFGFYYISKFLSNIWFSSFTNFFLGFFPLGIQSLTHSSISNQMTNLIDMGARWHPDSIGFMNNYGFIGIFVFLVFLGFFTRFLTWNITLHKYTLLSYISFYFILLQMVSLPIGNFIFTSSSNISLIVIISFFWIYIFLKLPNRL